jgi:hypothetical protein
MNIALKHALLDNKSQVILYKATQLQCQYVILTHKIG